MTSPIRGKSIENLESDLKKTCNMSIESRDWVEASTDRRKSKESINLEQERGQVLNREACLNAGDFFSAFDSDAWRAHGL